MRGISHSTTQMVEANQMFRLFLIIEKKTGFVSQGRPNMRPLNVGFVIYLVFMGLTKTGSVFLSFILSEEYPANIVVGRMCMKYR